MKPWKCQIKALQRPLDQLRVGDKFELSCSNPEAFKKKFGDTPYVVFKDDQKEFSVNILELKLDEHQEASFVATSYKAKEHKDLAFTVTDGEVSFPVDSLSFSVQSVLTKDSKMLGPTAPIKMFYAPLFWWTLGAVLATAVLSLAYIFYKKYRWKKALEDVEFNVQTSYQNFYTLTRKLLRQSRDTQGQILKLDELQKGFLLFLASAFRIPFHKKSFPFFSFKKRILKKYQNYYVKHEKELSDLMSDLSYEGPSSFENLEIMIFRCYTASEHILEEC